MGDASMADYVDDVVDDDARLEAAVPIAEQIDAVLDETRESTITMRRDILRLTEGRDWTAADLGAGFDDFDRTLDEAVSQLIQLREELKAQMTPDEWMEMFEQLEERLEVRAGS
jgi:hypothetical protein